MPSEAPAGVPAFSQATWRAAGRWAIALYCLWAAILIAQRPGLQYDEALFALGSVHMLNSPQEIGLPHDPDTWSCSFGRCFPLMTVRYAGAIKEYLLLPFNLILGPNVEILRAISMLLAAIGIWGIVKLIGEQLDQAYGAITAFVIAIHPAYVYQTVFDHGGVAAWMCALGLVCVALSRYLKLHDAQSAFWIGAAMGFGVWARANFVWMLGAILCAALILARTRLLVHFSHWAAAFAGGIVAGAPFFVYQLISKGGTWEAQNMFRTGETLGQQLLHRIVFFSEVLLSDREHRAMWDGPSMPDWQGWLFSSVVLASCIACLALRSRWDGQRSLLVQAMALTFLFLAAILLFSRLQISEHHLIALVPLGAVVTILAVAIVTRRFPQWGKPAAMLLLLVYIGCAADWQIAAFQGLRTSRGVGLWSDGVYEVARHLQEKYGNRDIKILDWGLQNSLYFLSGGKLRTREIFHNASSELSGLSRPWIDEIRDGGVFVMNGPGHLQFPAASIGIQQALVLGGPSFRRHAISQRNGAAYAEIIEIDPNTVRHEAAKPAIAAPKSIATGDLRYASLLDGFYQIEEGWWRWTKREFSVMLGSPDPPDREGSKLVLELYIPDFTIQKLGPVTLKARIGPNPLAPETYRQPGKHTFSRDLEAAWTTPGPNRLYFFLDKSLPPSPADGRELGMVVHSISLESR